MWLHVHGILCHAWNYKIYAFIAKTVGTYICVDDATLDQTKVDMARILVRTLCSLSIYEVFSIKIDGILFRIKFMEDAHLYFRLNQQSSTNKT